MQLEVIGGGAVPILGTENVQISIAGGRYDYEIVISANKENPNCILGSDFLRQHDCELSLHKQQFHVGSSVPKPAREIKTSLKIEEWSCLPGQR